MKYTVVLIPRLRSEWGLLHDLAIITCRQAKTSLGVGWPMAVTAAADARRRKMKWLMPWTGLKVKMIPVYPVQKAIGFPGLGKHGDVGALIASAQGVTEMIECPDACATELRMTCRIVRYTIQRRSVCGCDLSLSVWPALVCGLSLFL